MTALILFVFPRQEPLHEADAIVVLSPPGERLPAAIRAAEAGLAPHLWVSRVAEELLDRENIEILRTVCQRAISLTVTCFEPLSEDTFGEARTVAKLVEANNAKSVIIATDASHAVRARYLFERCLPAGTKVQMLLIDEPDSPSFLFGRMIYETGGFAKAIAEARTCER
ncbi:YdcF family protein [Microbacterium sp. LRZ72]|uniref:YdcF family protein n=1 Tax=Microbacterium sp. LRZ72 TaxID=2942481 RepID=UPI0029A5F407|nr:YdcF family protein [Microbacterium sp. LRZ72]MDX2377641.1 YdcF family protein [Microbacterium sp. LRZ72]